MNNQQSYFQFFPVLLLVIIFQLPLYPMAEKESVRPIQRSEASFALTGHPAQIGNHLIFNFEGYSLELDLTNLACLIIDMKSQANTIISKAAFTSTEYRINGKLSEVSYPKLGLTVNLGFENKRFTMELASNRSQSINWPKTPLKIRTDNLILPRGEGQYIPLADDGWRNYLLQSKQAFSEFLSMPFWGIEYDKGLMLTFMVSNPFHNQLLFDKGAGKAGVDISLQHWFPDNHDVYKSIAVTVCVDNDTSDLLLPARHFRERLMESGQWVSFREKIGKVPLNERLIGAIQGVLHGGDVFTVDDIKTGQAKALARHIMEDAANAAHSLGAHIISMLQAGVPEHRDAVLQLAGDQWEVPYLRIVFCYVMSGMLRSTGFYHEDIQPGCRVGYPLYNADSPPAEIVRFNCALFYAHYGAYLNPPAAWGSAVSTRMIDMVAGAGYDRFRFQVDGVEQIVFRPEVAAYADAKGFLIGPYDSYHSIHDPRYAGTDSSWETAQFGQFAYDNGGVRRAAGSSVPGFLGRGKIFSPLFARSYYEKRIADNFEQVPFNYYFIDCDAFGEYFDDYTNGRIVSQREDAGERIDRIRWLAETRSVPVGSEGGFYLFTPVLSIVEGLLYPVIGWGDKEMKDPASEYFTGRYWPPYEPGINFKQVPLKDKYYHLYIDPRFKLPLYEAVFHDSVISIPRDGGTRKFTNAQHVLELCHLLYQIPPLYHLSLQSGGEILNEAFPLCKVFRASHEYSSAYPLIDFDYLTEDRLVQKSVFGALEITANFRDTGVNSEGRIIPAMSVILVKGDDSRAYSAR